MDCDLPISNPIKIPKKYIDYNDIPSSFSYSKYTLPDKNFKYSSCLIGPNSPFIHTPPDRKKILNIYMNIYANTHLSKNIN